MCQEEKEEAMLLRAVKTSGNLIKELLATSDGI